MKWWPWKRGAAKSQDGTLELFKQVFGGTPTMSGETVTWRTALEVTTCLAIARVISDGIAQVPLKLFRESDDGKTRLPAKEHPLYRLLHRRPNAFQTSFEYREQLAMHLVFTGNHFSFVNRSGPRGQITELLPFEPGQVTVRRDPTTLELTYEVRYDSGATLTIPAEAMWHVRGPSWNGWMGLEPVKLAREAIGLSMATEHQHAALHRNGVSPSGIYSVEGKLNGDQYAQLRKAIEDRAGGSNKGAPLILDRAAKWTTQAMTGVDAQHLETRKFQVEEICRAWRVMPLMVGYSANTGTYGTAEQIFLAHVVHTMAPWWERIEQSIDCHLLTAKDAADGVYAKFIEEGLLRGAMKDTAEYLTALTDRGVMTRNEARAKLDLNPLEGLDEPLTPVNLGVGADPAPAAAPPAAPSPPVPAPAPAPAE